MKIKGVHHIAVNTLDIEESIRFYEEILGFEVCSRADMGPLDLVYLKITENQFLELFDLRGNAEAGSVTGNQQGLRHIALDVEDVEAWNRKLKEKQVEITEELSVLGPISKKCVLFKDPNGVIIELSQDA